MLVENLVSSLKQRSPEAFEELVQNYGRRLYFVSFRILRNAEDAEDTVQETFLKAFQNIDSFREESSLYSWLYRIVTNESLLKLRKKGPSQVVPIDPYLPHFEGAQHVAEIMDWTELPDFALHTQELGEFFERCITELPEEYRIAYLLKDVEKLSEDEVCNILGVSKATMKNRVHRARLVIRKRVENYFYKGDPMSTWTHAQTKS